MAETGTGQEKGEKGNGRFFFTAFGDIREIADGSVLVDGLRLARSQFSELEEGIAAGKRAQLRIAVQVEKDGEGRQATTLWLERAKPVKARETAAATT